MMTDGRRNRTYLSPEDVDRLARQNTQLMAELWIVKDRLAVLEHLLELKGVVATEEIGDFLPENDLAAHLDRERERYIQRIQGFGPGERTTEALRAMGTTD